MEEKKMISINDFMYMFIVVNYLRDNKCLDIGLLKEYLKRVFDNEIKSKMISEASFDEEINNSLDQMIGENIISHLPCFNYLIKIADKIPAMDILRNNFSYLDSMIRITDNYIRYASIVDKESFHIEDKSICLYDNQEKKKVKTV